jgi:large subunit ribosomal protein L21
MTIVMTGGKQYIVQPEKDITVEKLPQKVGETVILSDILTGQPVSLEVIKHLRSPKIVIRKFRNKTRYNRLKGHRQPYTVMRLQTSAPSVPKQTRNRQKPAKVGAETDK